jgi:diadenosine tetraphosphate (Ap4A) HIT family hydrolase
MIGSSRSYRGHQVGVREAQTAFTFLDAYQVSPGYTFVVSRQHVADAFDLTADEIVAGFRLVGSARDRIDLSLRPSGCNVGVNISRERGQTVLHVHVHVIPRYPGDCEDPSGGVRSVILGKARYP